MNQPDLDILNPSQLDCLRGDFGAITADSEFGSVSITYKHGREHAGVDIESGVVTRNEVKTETVALIAPMEEDLGGGEQRGDTRFLIDAQNLPFEPKADDCIDVDTVLYQVLRASADVSGLIWVVECGREGTDK